MRPLLKLLLFAIVSAIVTRLAALVVSRQFEEGSEVSDEFRRMTILSALDFTSRAGGLRSAEVSVVLGGSKIDLRDAVIDPAGARILAENTLGGLVLIVREDWAVDVNEIIVGGGENEIRTTPLTDLPDDAPRLEIELITRLGGSVIATRDASL